MIYLDHAATSPLLPEVKKAMHAASERLFGNAASIHTPGHTAHQKIEKAREVVARLINAEPSEIIFTSGATEGNNTVMHIFAGQNIAVSAFEHPSVIRAAEIFSKKVEIMQNSTGAASCQPVVTGGTRLYSAVASVYPLKNFALISTQLANHEIGTIFPIQELAAEAHKNGAKFHTDATQAIGKIPVDVKQLDVDYLTFSAHKFGGPTGIGVLYVKSGAPFKPLLYGGHQENGRRAGTHNTLGIIGLAAAAQYILDRNTPKLYADKIRPLRDTLERRILEQIKRSSVNKLSGKHCDEPTVVFTDVSLKPEEVTSSEGLKTKRCKNDVGVRSSLTDSLFTELPNILNISFKGAEGESIQLYLDHEGIVVSTGSACAATDGQPSPVLMALHGDAEVAHSSIRFSLGLDTTAADIDKIMETLPNIIKQLQEISTI